MYELLREDISRLHSTQLLWVWYWLVRTRVSEFRLPWWRSTRSFRYICQNSSLKHQNSLLFRSFLKKEMSSKIQCVQTNFFQQMILLNELQNSDTPGCQYQTPCLCLSCILAFVKIFWPSFHGNLFTFNLFGSPVEKLMIQLPGCSAPPVTSVLLCSLAVSALKKS